MNHHRDRRFEESPPQQALSKKERKKAEKAKKKNETSAEKEARQEIIQGHKARKNICIFCEIRDQPGKPKILYEDNICFAFLDRNKKSSKEHILVCPKEHLKSTASLRENDVELLNHLQKAGEKILARDFPKDEHRFGYHAAPLNSVNHLHLHCLVLPLTIKYYDEVVYGENLTSTETLIDKLKGKEIRKNKKLKEEEKEAERKNII